MDETRKQSLCCVYWFFGHVLCPAHKPICRKLEDSRLCKISKPDRIQKKKKKGRSSTFTTTAVTPLSTQKNVSDLLAYCSENLRITSRDFSDGSPAEISNCENQHLNCYITEPCGSCPQKIYFSNLFNCRKKSMRFLNPDIYRPKILATAFFLKQTKRFYTEVQQKLFDSFSLPLPPKSVLLAH